MIFYSAFRVHGGLEPLVELIKENKDNTNRDNKVRIYSNKILNIYKFPNKITKIDSDFRLFGKSAANGSR